MLKKAALKWTAFFISSHYLNFSRKAPPHYFADVC